MRTLLFLFVFIFCTFTTAEPMDRPAPTLDLDMVPLSQVIRVVYKETLESKSYVISPEALGDQRLVSFRYSPKDGDFLTFFHAFLRSLGFIIQIRSNADFIVPIPAVASFSPVEDPALDIFFYRPKYRDGAYLVEMLTPLFKGRFTVQRAISGSEGGVLQSQNTVAAQGSALANIQQGVDQLLFSGSKKEIESLQKLFAQIDTDPGQVIVSGVLYEVQLSEHNGSALSLASSILGGKLNLNFGVAAPADNFLSIKAGALSAIVQALDSDSRFNILSTPQVRVKSGKTAIFNVGEDVPVLGSITYPQGASTPVQSVDYRSSGVIFTVSPTVRDGFVDVNIDQQVSSFAQTTTGLNNTPTLTKRQLSSVVSARDGEVIVIGGLRQRKDSQAGAGLNILPNFMKSKSSDLSSNEILLFLKVERI